MTWFDDRPAADPVLPPAVAGLVTAVSRGDAARPTVIQTHISWVVVTGRHAFKLKKPLALDFLDYSTLEKRLEACQREVELNRRLCPTVYLGVVPLLARDRRVSIGPILDPDGADIPTGGRVAEYAVAMRRLPQGRMLDVLVAHGRATCAMVEEVADRLARFHAAARTGPGVDDFGTPRVILQNVRENADQTRRFIGRSIDRSAFDRIQRVAFGFPSDHEGLLRRRVATGRIRDGHGDLHAANICLTDPLAIFDCIEFNDRFRCGDVAAEVAFLAMDLEYRGRGDLARAFVERYIRASSDRELRPLLEFYGCYRAYVRGKVESFKLDGPGFSASARSDALVAARRYFALARSYADAVR